MNALQKLLTTVRDRKWCVQPYCTTCGARDYRQAIHDNAAALVEALKTARISELRSSFPEIFIDDALRLLMMELASPIGPMHISSRALGLELEGTEAGEYLAGMRRHAAGVVRKREERETFQSPDVAAERRRLKKQARRGQHELRTQRKREREAVIAAAVRGFEGLSPTQAIGRLMRGEAGFPLYRLPEAQVEAMAGVLAGLSDGELARLREQVPVTRAAPLARLSRAIDRELRAGGRE